MAKNIESTSEIQRRCLLDPDNKGCVNCSMDTCPYLYCQKLDCLNCSLRLICPMCEGECTKCRYNTVCMISRQKS